MLGLAAVVLLSYREASESFSTVSSTRVPGPVPAEQSLLRHRLTPALLSSPPQTNAGSQALINASCPDIVRDLDMSHFRCLSYKVSGSFQVPTSPGSQEKETFLFRIEADPRGLSHDLNVWDVEIELLREENSGYKTTVLNRHLRIGKDDTVSEMHLHYSHPEIRDVLLEALGFESTPEAFPELATYQGLQSCSHVSDSQQWLEIEYGWTRNFMQGRIRVTDPVQGYLDLHSESDPSHKELRCTIAE